MEPLVSVIIPAFNSAFYIRECVESVLNQSYKNIEIIVVDDGSTDDTISIIDSYSGKINLIRSAHRGLGGARNLGNEIARGKFISWLDADDIAHPKLVEIQAAFLESHSEIALISTNFSAFDESGLISTSYIKEYYSAIGEMGGIDKIYQKKECFPVEIDPSKLKQNFTSFVSIYSGMVYKRLVWGNFIHPPTVMLRTSVVRATAKLDESIPTAEDWDYFIRVSRVAPVAFIDFPLIDYRIHANQLSSRTNSGLITTNIIRVFEKLKNFDHDLYQRNLKYFRYKLGLFHANAAYTLSEESCTMSIMHIFKSLQYGYWSKTLIKSLVKAILPKFILNQYYNFNR